MSCVPRPLESVPLKIWKGMCLIAFIVVPHSLPVTICAGVCCAFPLECFPAKRRVHVRVPCNAPPPRFPSCENACAGRSRCHTSCMRCDAKQHGGR